MEGSEAHKRTGPWCGHSGDDHVACRGDALWQVAEERSLAGLCGSPLCALGVSAQRAQRTRWRTAAAWGEDGGGGGGEGEGAGEGDGGAGARVRSEQGALYCSRPCAELVRRYAEVLGDPMQVNLLGTYESVWPGSRAV